MNEHHCRGRLMAFLRSTAGTLFLLSFLSYAFFYQGGGQNEAARFDSIRSVLEQRRLIIDSYARNSADVIVVNSHVYSGKAPGTFYLGFVPYTLTVGALNLFGVNPEVRDHWACYTATLFSISLPGALSVVLLFWLGLRLRFSERDSAAVALAIGLGTIFFTFSTVFFSHVTAAFCLLLAFYLILAHKQNVLIDDSPERARKERWRLWLAGFGLGFSITLEYPSAIAVVLIGLYALPTLWRRRDLRPQIAVLILGGLAALLPLFIYNWIAFRNAFYVTYEAYAQSSNTLFAAHKKGVLGIRFPLFDPSAWPQFWSNLQEITYRPLRGLFFANPFLLLIFPGFILLCRKSIIRTHQLRDEAILALFMFLGYVAFNASFGDSITYWGGGASFGPRYLIVMLPFLALPLLAALKRRWLRSAFAPLALLSTFICLMATAVEPRTPYSPPNPIFFFYLPRYMTSMLAMNGVGIFSNHHMTDNSVSFTLGRLIGLPIQFQLVPLFLIWLICAWRLDRQLRVEGRGFLYAAGILVLIAAWVPIGALT